MWKIWVSEFTVTYDLDTQRLSWDMEVQRARIWFLLCFAPGRVPQKMVHPVVQALLMERSSEKQCPQAQLLPNPTCRPASQHSENAFGNFYFHLLLNMKSNCVFIALISWPSLGITLIHFVWQDSESISRGGNNEAIERSDEDCPSLPTSLSRSLFWNSHWVRP